MIDELQPPFGISLTLHKKMPIGSGLGSSGASSAAAVFAVNCLLPKPLSKMDLLRFAVEGERLASGSPHADNVAPSLLGGACLIKDYHPLSVIKLPVKNVFYWVVVHPHFILETQRARGVLPSYVPLSVTTSQLGCLGGLLTGLITGNKQLTGMSIRDHLAEPVRAELIPGFYAARMAAIETGALGFSISGSGPSVFALAASRASAVKIAQAIKRAFYKNEKIKSDSYISKINQQGTKIIG
jgi:homoserine kinase